MTVATTLNLDDIDWKKVKAIEIDEAERPMTAYELDLALQLQTNPNLVPVERCDGMDGPLPCSKPKGHTGPHYFHGA